MRTIERIQEEIKAIKSNVANPKRPTQKEIRAINKGVRPLLHCIAYLETNPTEQLLESELARIEKRFSILNLRYSAWADSITKAEINYEEPRSYYEKANDYPHIRSQIKTLKYLLEK